MSIRSFAIALLLILSFIQPVKSVDITPPDLVLSQDDITILEASSGNYLYWNATDANPATYVIKRNGTQEETGSWNNASMIVHQVRLLPIGFFLYTIDIEDIDGNTVSDSLIITVIDGTPPDPTSPPNRQVIHGTSANFIGWSASDTHPSYYELFVNHVVTVTNTWSVGTTYNFNLDSLGVGEYNYTMVFYDESGNAGADTAIVTVYDISSPTVSQPSDIVYTEYDTGNTIVWTLSDPYPGTYVTYIDGNFISLENWDNVNNTATLNVDNLSPGTYIYSIKVNDEFGNYVFDYVNVTVVPINDTTDPSFTYSVDNLEFVEGAAIKTIYWTVIDDNPTTYDIFIDEVYNISGSWESGVDITYDVSDFTLGIYNFTIVVYDIIGNFATHYVNMSILDAANPVILDYPSGPYPIQVEYGTTNNTISWTVNDLYPGFYEVYDNDDPFDFNVWFSDVPIVVNLDSLSEGLHNITIRVWDASGNPMNSSVMVNVYVNPDFDAPILNQEPSNATIVEGQDGYSVQWNVTDPNPLSYLLYLNGTIIEEDYWASGLMDIYIPDNLVTGFYNLTIVFSDASNNTLSSTIFLTVIDTSVPTVGLTSNTIFSGSDETREVSWIASDLHPLNYTIMVNNTVVFTGYWTDGIEITYSIANLAEGWYNITIILEDESKNIDSNWVIITITAEIDVERPAISNPGDMTFEEGSTNQHIVWLVTDENPGSYYITINGVESISLTQWSNGTIELSVSDLDVGSYEIIIYVYDIFDNLITDTVFVIVEPMVISTPTEISSSSNQSTTEIPPSSSIDNPSTSSTSSELSSPQNSDVAPASFSYIPLIVLILIGITFSKKSKFR